jgi:hypothetical protein
MNDAKKTRCPECGAVNGPGAPTCHGCGLTLRRTGSAVREEDNDEPQKPVKKPAPDAVQKGPPPKKKPTRPVDDDETEEERRPAKKGSRRDDEDEDERRAAKKKAKRDEDDAEGATIRDNPILNIFFPVGVSLWAMASNYLGLFAAVGAFLGFALPFMIGGHMKVLGYILAGFGILFGGVAILVGLLSFIIRPKKTTYGSVTGYFRALVGMALGLAAVIAGPIIIWYVWKEQF